ncbi:secreted RxLR effector protein 161-like [Harmonia axyridis]|uniref:secreted RxLR effector protein 161-like n=1 Tax=Harmonia axyridis TaxID=115357 RepID=UPI001E276921|nr:secreted RxLR effector protein 161-like [Harmonia axyridis]
MTECKGVKTPLDKGLDFNKVDKNIRDPNIPYQNLIGGLMYLSVLTRPDIAFSVSFLSQYNNKYTDVHCQSAKRILRYLKETKKVKLKYFKNDNDLEGFADADWANDKSDRRSYTGFVFRLSGGAISWQSMKQRTVALSSTEAEYMALSEAVKEAIYLKNLLFELVRFKDRIVVFNDNQGAQKLLANPSNHCRTKHIDVRHHFVRDCVDQKQINVQYISTDEMVADILTKGLNNVKNSNFCSKLGLVYV